MHILNNYVASYIRDEVKMSLQIKNIQCNTIKNSQKINVIFSPKTMDTNNKFTHPVCHVLPLTMHIKCIRTCNASTSLKTGRAESVDRMQSNSFRNSTKTENHNIKKYNKHQTSNRPEANFWGKRKKMIQNNCI